MGETCCRRDANGGEAEVGQMEPYNITEQAPPPKRESVPPADPKQIAELTAKFGNFGPSISRIQAWYRGARTRRLRPAPPLTPLTIIKYIGEKMGSPEEAVRKMEEKLGPFIISWDLAAAKTTLELRPCATEPNGAVYHGYWSRATGKKHGYGQQLFPNGTKYEGLWMDGEFDGNGRFIYENGDYYVGDWKEGKTEGQGTFVSGEGTRYTGGWKNNLHHGYGTTHDFIMPFVGIETWEDGSHFEGNYVEGSKEGKGKFKWTDGSMYEGDFVNNKLMGSGIPSFFMQR